MAKEQTYLVRTQRKSEDIVRIVQTIEYPRGELRGEYKKLIDEGAKEQIEILERDNLNSELELKLTLTIK